MKDKEVFYRGISQRRLEMYFIRLFMYYRSRRHLKNKWSFLGCVYIADKNIYEFPNVLVTIPIAINLMHCKHTINKSCLKK